MNTFEKNVVNALGERGSQWLLSLPHIIQTLSEHWNLSALVPAQNMSWNYVAFAKRHDAQHVVLKISFDEKVFQDEYKTLKHFNGVGAIKVLDINTDHHAMLLEQAIPGTILKDCYNGQVESTIGIYSQVIRQLSLHKKIDAGYVHVSSWCEDINKINDNRVHNDMVKRAKQISSELLNSAEHEYICHGDLHLENIIQANTKWVAIDPKGIIGEMAFEASAFDLFSSDETGFESSAKMDERIKKLSSTIDIDYRRLLLWVFLRMMTSIQWFIEDNGDPSRMLKQVNLIYPLLK